MRVALHIEEYSFAFVENVDGVESFVQYRVEVKLDLIGRAGDGNLAFYQVIVEESLNEAVAARDRHAGVKLFVAAEVLVDGQARVASRSLFCLVISIFPSRSRKRLFTALLSPTCR